MYLVSGQTIKFKYKKKMDKVDEWMKRTLEQREQSSNPAPTKQGQFGKQKNLPQSSRRAQTHVHNTPPQAGLIKNVRACLPVGMEANTFSNKQKYNKNNFRKMEKHTTMKNPIEFKKTVPKTRMTKFKPTPILKGKLKIISLGGLDEVGKNMIALEYENDIVIMDMGLEFPNEELYGIDYVIPDTDYLENNKKRIRGVVLTHGHLDHIGGIPYIIPKLDFPPIYGTKLTIGLVKKKIEEFKQDRMAHLYTIDPDKALRLGKFLITFIRVAHSIPDAVSIVVDTPVGKIVNTGDFKFDETPPKNQGKADIHKMEALGKQNVLALFCESTNALKPGHSMSESEVGKILEDVMSKTKGRLIVASFSSQIGRIQQIITAAAKNNRKIFVSGRSMRENIEIAHNLGYLEIPKDTMFDIKKYKNKQDKETLILTTGSQGESMSALARIANNEHQHIKIKKEDTIIISASPIIGNERGIFTIINQLSILGADVIHNQIMEVHTSGHGKQDELARMINYIKPKYLVPVHGEYFMRQALAKLANQKCNIPKDHIIMIENGDVLVAEHEKLSKSSEKVETKYILIDGRGEGHIGSQVQMERAIMSENGVLIVLIYISKKGKALRKDPDIVSRGFIYMHESEEITKEISVVAAKAYRNIMEKNRGATRRDIKYYIKGVVDKYTSKKLERRPLIVPLIIEI